MSSLEQFIVFNVFISKLADKLGLRNTGGRPPNNTTLLIVSHSHPPRSEGCVGCLDRSYYHQSCPIIADYISRGLCKRDDMRRVVLMDGTLVTTRLAPGKCIKERIDNWLKSHTQPTVSTNMVEALQTASTSQAPDTPINEVYVSEVSTADLEELRMLDSVAVSTLKQADSIRKRISNTAKGKPMPTPATRSAVKAGKASLIPTFSHTLANTQSSPTSSQSPPFAPVPFFSTHTRWHSNIEDPDVIQRVIDKSLGNTVTLTYCELYVISSDTRQYLKDNVTTWKVPIPATASTNTFEEVEEDNASVETFLQSTSLPSNLIVGKSIVELSQMATY